jgi:DNA processing protein
MKPRALSEGERADWLRLSRSRGVGPITFATLLERYGDARSALKALPGLVREGSVEIASAADIQREMAAAAAQGARFIASYEPDYPPALAAIPAPPPVIAARGDAALLKRPAVALVGARNSAAVGRRMARDLASDLSAAGYVVVSGLARGVDGEAHAASLDGGTIAVIAGGVDQVYPPEHAALYDQIVGRGVVVSEAPMGYVAQARDFPKRNRIISGLCMACVVVEAAERSGSLITARAALEQGREVMAVPGSPLDPRCAGANRLIKQGAALIESAADILAILDGLPPLTLSEPDARDFSTGPPAGDTPPVLLRAVLEALSPTPMPVDEIARAVDAPHRAVAAALMELELAGRVLTHVGGLASLNVDRPRR